MEQEMKEKVEQLVDYIMKKCLWQFNSRLWDREKQNEKILEKTMQILCEEQVDVSSPAEKCYWAEAMTLVEAFRKKYSWINAMNQSEIKLLIKNLKERMDFLTISGSLNAELSDAQY